ncbi:MAG: NAD(P)-binding protein [Solirubrobacterales bacterium]
MEKPFAITLDVGSSLANKTGAWRDERPQYVDRMPPCNDACPAGENIQQWLYHAEGGDYEAAWREIVKDNPFPAVMGRVCYHPCTTACNRAQLDEAVGINSVERFLGDEAIRNGWSVPAPAARSGKRVLIVGAGPSGLAAAHHLALRGHEVEIHDAGPRPGGMMRFGIPAYRLPRDVLDAEIARVLALGVTLRSETKVTDILATIRAGAFDAAFLAVGAHIGRRAYIPAGDSARILDAVSLLRGMEQGERPRLGRTVVVYGGGNTAMDAARTARRLGAHEAIVVYRRTRERMPAHDAEVREALQEGVEMRWLSTIRGAEQGRLTVERMELDEHGFPQPTGELEQLEADSVVLALGQEADLSLLQGVPGLEFEDGVVRVAPNMMTGHPGIFAGGDMVPAERTVTVAAGHGKRAARHIDEWLRQEGREEDVARSVAPPAGAQVRAGGLDASARNGPGTLDGPLPRHELAGFDMLNTWYYADAPATVAPRLDAVRRQSTFEEVQLGLDETNALFEARRCLSCGNCFECDNCYAVCPDNAVIKLALGEGHEERAGERHGEGHEVRYEIDYDYCKGCGLCAEECPCGAIEMLPDPGLAIERNTA